MKRRILLSLIPAAALAAAPDYPVTPVPFTAVTLTGGPLAARQATNSAVTIPFCLAQCESSGRLKNFDLAAEAMRRRAAGETNFSIKPPTIYPFDDTDVYKAIEAAAYDQQLHPDPARRAAIEKMIARVRAAQEPDGYLYTFKTMCPEPYKGAWYGKAKFERDPRGSHETYNLGHLYEAATAWHAATGSRTLLDIALKTAALADRDLRNVVSPPGHQIIEMGLVKLYRDTGDARWLTLARHFLDSRTGAGGPYDQQHLPILKQEKAIGHAVRANYMYAGMTDIAALQNDPAYKAAVEKLWQNVVGTKYHLTGGCGWNPEGEAYGENYVLPSACYNETCAALAFLFWTHRLFLLTGDSCYMDAFERTLYNGALSGVSLSGDRFFYPNTLEYDGAAQNNHGHAGRAPWFGCACCPPNIMRTLASLGQYFYATKGNTLLVSLYAAGRVTADGFTLEQRTDYPTSGKIELAILSAPAGTHTLALRIPGWAEGKPVPTGLYTYEPAAVPPVSIQVNGTPVEAPRLNGYAVISRVWKAGDRIALNLPMVPRRVKASTRVSELADQVAFERGPVVYAFEASDQPDKTWRAWSSAPADKLEAEWRPDLLGGSTVLRVGDKLAIPYALWNNRGNQPMRVWLRESQPQGR